MDLKNAKVLVTGGAGFIGSHLVDALVREGAHVRVLDNMSNGKLENLSQAKNNKRIEVSTGDITVPSDVASAMEEIDVVFHLACLGVRHSIRFPIENHRVNAKGSLVVLEEARKKKVKRFIYCSSSEVYGTAESVPMPENHPTHPCTVYGASKLAGEAYARAYYLTYGMATVMVRPFNTYGPRSHHEGDAGEMIPKSIVRSLGGKAILLFGDGLQTRDFTYVEDVAKAFIDAACCDTAVGHTFNIGSGFEISMEEIAQRILKIAGCPEGKIERLAARPGDVLRLYADAKAFCVLTGWSPKIGLEEGLSRTVQYFRSRPEGIETLVKQEAGRNWE